jgi:hypothetical protein
VTPDFDVRLQSVIKALEQVILPAVDPANPLALEQAALAIGHLHMMRGQLPYLSDYVNLCRDEIARLGESLTAIAAGGAETLAAAVALAQALRGAADPALPPAQGRELIAQAVDALIRASGVDGSETFRDESENLVLDYGIRQTSRDRAWFKASGLDPDCAKLPSAAEILSAARG